MTSQNLRRFASCQAVPTRVGPEALAIALRQPFELGADVFRAARSRVVHGPAAERRKAGSEDHGGVDRILIRHDAFAQAGDRDVEHGENQTIGHLLRGFWRVAVLHRLAVAPLVKPLPLLRPRCPSSTLPRSACDTSGIGRSSAVLSVSATCKQMSSPTV